MNETAATIEGSTMEAPHTVLGLLPFTIDKKGLPYSGLTSPSKEEPTHSNLAYSHMAAALLAIDHFNTRNPVVVPELAEAPYQDCQGWQFSDSDLQFVNSDGSPFAVSQYLLEEVAYQNKRILAMVGPYTNDAALTAATLATGMDVPMVSHGADDVTLTRYATNPRVARTTPTLYAIGDIVVNAMLQQLHRSDVLATVHVTREIGDQSMQAVDNAAAELVHPTTAARFTRHDTYSVAPPFFGFVPNQGVGYALQKIKETGVRNIFLVLREYSRQLPIVADYAEEFGLNTGDYVWMLNLERGSDLAHVMSVANDNANITKLFHGMGHVAPLDGFQFDDVDVIGKTDSGSNNNDSTGDAFHDEWKLQNATFVERLNQLHPIQKPKQEGYYQAKPDYFRLYKPQPGAAYFYDAIMSVALGKCLYLQSQTEKEEEALLMGTEEIEEEEVRNNPKPNNNNNNNNSRRLRALQRSRPPPAFPINEYFESILDNNFTGATGHLRFRESARFKGSRPKDDVVYGLYNFRPMETKEQAMNANNYSHWYYLTGIHTGATSTGSWEPTSHAPFIFANGLSTPPLLNRNLPVQNYLSPNVQITGLVFMSMALLAGILSALFIFIQRRKMVILQAQPPFLQMLIFGTIMMSMSILTLSFDESYGFSDSALDACCLATPWLLSLGYNTIYLALFSKLWRLNRVMQFQRVKIQARQAVGPFIAVMLATVAVLVAWTIVAPWQWNREVIDEVTMESYGKCQSENSLPFFIPLICLVLLSTLACGLMSFKCRDIDESYSDSNYIFYTIFVQIQVLLVGIPVLGILNDSSADATFLGRSLLIFVMAMTTLMLMILPKVLAVFRGDTDGDMDSSLRRRCGTGSVQVRGFSEGSASGNASRSSPSAVPSNTHNHRTTQASFRNSPSPGKVTFNDVICDNGESSQVVSNALKEEIDSFRTGDTTITR